MSLTPTPTPGDETQQEPDELPSAALPARHCLAPLKEALCSRKRLPGPPRHRAHGHRVRRGRRAV